jgi:Protein of unknown function (DUF3592)
MAVPIALLIVGLALCIGGIASRRRFRRIAKATSVSGTIVDSEQRFTGRSGASFPIVDFRTLKGKTMRVTVHQGRVFSNPRVGKQVQVIYNTARPGEAYINSFGLRYGSYLFVAAGLCIAILAATQL